MKSQPKISFFFEKNNISLRNRKKLKEFIFSVFKKEKKKLSNLTYVFCSDQRLLEINRQFLNHDYYTDIITFDLSESNGGIVGEVYISTDRIRDNAKSGGQSIVSELHRVIFHGVLHLCGYNDKKGVEKTLMRQKEDFYIHLYRS